MTEPKLLLRGELVRAARERAGLTQAQLAQRVQRTEFHIANIEAGRSRARQLVIHRIAKELGVSVESITVRMPQ